MTENTVSRLWFMRTMFILLSVGVIFLHLLPLSTLPGTLAAPDIILALAFCWALRRPEFVPALLIGLVMLFADLMMSRPPGLFAAIALVAVEMLKARASQLLNTPFSVEWITASMAIAAVIVGYRLILMLLLVESFALSTALVQILFTILIYPVVIGVSWVFFGLRKPTLGEVNALGQRL